MGALIEDKELVRMVQHYALDNRFFEKSPLLQEMHRRGWDEGERKGFIVGHQEGRQEGEITGIALGMVEAILETLSLRLGKDKLNLVMSRKILEDMDKQQLHTALS